MLKTYELRDIIASDLNDFEPSEDWDTFIQVEYEKESSNVILVNFIELTDSGLSDNKYKITIEPIYE